MKLLPSKDEFTKEAEQEYKRLLDACRPGRPGDLIIALSMVFTTTISNLYDWMDTREGL